MDIAISNCKNVKKLNMEIVEGRLNVLIAPSGSGKSTIKEALYNFDTDKLCSVYCTEDPTAMIDGVPVFESKVKFEVFDDTFRDKVLFEKEMLSNDVYNIFIGDGEDYQAYMEAFAAHFSQLRSLDFQIVRFIEDVENIEQKILKCTNKYKIHMGSKLIRFENRIANLEEKGKKYLRNYKSNFYNWMQEGTRYTEYIDSGKCPFCKRKMTVPMNRRIETIRAISANDFKILEESKPVLESVNLPIPDFFKKRELASLKKRIIQKIIAKDEAKKIIDFIEGYKSFTGNNIPDNLAIKAVLYENLPELEEVVVSINSTIKNLKIEHNKCQSNLNKKIRKKEDKLNSYLSTFGIPYEFQSANLSNETKMGTYKLYHIADQAQAHRVSGLSYGEKNIIALLLFLMKTESDYVIIDDPASSYDEHKRSTIYNIIKTVLKNKTVLLLSHDCTFAKFLSLDKKDKSKNSPEKGNLMLLENYDYGDEAEIEHINYNDFSLLEVHVVSYMNEHAGDLDYWSKLVLIRMLIEPKKDYKKFRIIYGYLSAIVHRTPRIEIEDWLDEKSTCEDTILLGIKELLKENGIKGVTLEPYFEGLPFPENANLFISLMFVRELITNRDMKRELSSIVHLNEAQLIQLNPFKFRCYSKKVYDCINNPSWYHY